MRVEGGKRVGTGKQNRERKIGGKKDRKRERRGRIAKDLVLSEAGGKRRRRGED